MKIRRDCFIFVTFLILVSCATPIKKARPIPIIGSEKIQKGIIEANGLGAAEPRLTDPKKRKKSSLAKATQMAREELESIVMGLELSNGERLQEDLVSNQELSHRLKKALKKSKIVKKNWTNDEGCIVRLRIEKKFLEKKLKIKFR